jgi:hypothetical protein
MSNPSKHAHLGWIQSLRRLGATHQVRMNAHEKILREGISIIHRAPVRHKLALAEQPFDRHLLVLSPLFRKSRELFLAQGGEFHPALLSSPRTLSSPTLLDNKIEYSPIETELFWTATHPGERKDKARLLSLRSYVSSLFHEQNHRILWQMLPPSPRSAQGVRRYLNFAESLVITLDMALGDELGRGIAGYFYLTGATYDPGTTVREELKPFNRRYYRNYLQAALHATYLNLEFFEPREIPKAVSALFPGLIGPKGKDNWAERAAKRSGNLDRAFVWKTNPSWQKKHWEKVMKRLSGPSPLELPDNPMDNRAQYLFAEKCFEAFGL